MPGLDLITELRLFKKRLEDIVSEIELYYERIVFKQTLYNSREFVIYHIEYIEDLLRDIEDLENLTQIQKQRAKTLLKPFQGLFVKLVTPPHFLQQMQDGESEKSYLLGFVDKE